MTIKDIERRGSYLRGNTDIDFYLEVLAPDRTDYIWFKSFDTLIKYVKENYTDNLINKADANKKIIDVRIWRNR